MKKLIILLAIFSSLVFAKSSVEVHGTSTLHDWKMASEKLDVKMVEENGKFSTLDVSMVIETLKSDSEGLNENAYEAMKVDKFNVVKFSLLKHNDDGTITGVFKVLDKEREETLTPTVIEAGHIAGSFKVNMSEFGIEPPTFMFGAMGTGDEVTIKYNIEK